MSADWPNPRTDLERFAKLIEWHRILPLDGDDFLAFPRHGLQPPHIFKPEVEDREHLHWWFYDARFISHIPIYGGAKDIIMRNPVRFNIFLRGLDTSSDGTRILLGWNVMKKRYPDVEDYLKQKYAKTQYQFVEELVQKEHQLQIQHAVETTNVVYKKLARDCPTLVDISKSLPKVSSPSPVPKRLVSFSSTELDLVHEDEMIVAEPRVYASSPRRHFRIKSSTDNISQSSHPETKKPNAPARRSIVPKLSLGGIRRSISNYSPGRIHSSRLRRDPSHCAANYPPTPSPPGLSPVSSPRK